MSIKVKIAALTMLGSALTLVVSGIVHFGLYGLIPVALFSASVLFVGAELELD